MLCVTELMFDATDNSRQINSCSGINCNGNIDDYGHVAIFPLSTSFIKMDMNTFVQKSFTGAITQEIVCSSKG